MRTALVSFVQSVSRIRDIAQNIDAEASSALASHLVGQRHETIQAASLVVLSGYLESFIKTLAEAFVRSICSKGLSFSGLPEDIRHAHFVEGGRVLSESVATKRKSRPSWIIADGADIARRLHSVSSAEPYELLWEAFADTQANPGPEVIHDFLHRFGIRKIWPKLAALMAKPEAFIVTSLRNLILLRNECAHTGHTVDVPTPSELRDFCDLLEGMASAMVGLLEQHLNELCTPAPASAGGHRRQRTA
jgi:RiboL-PSP-HEPN